MILKRKGRKQRGGDNGDRWLSLKSGLLLLIGYVLGVVSQAGNVCPSYMMSPPSTPLDESSPWQPASSKLASSSSLQQQHQEQNTSEAAAAACSPVTTTANTPSKFLAHEKALADASIVRGYEPASIRANKPLNDTKGSYWWFDEKVPEALSFPKLDMAYEKGYFKGSHIPFKREPLYVKYVNRLTQLFMPAGKVHSMVEFGNGGGHFTELFVQQFAPRDFITVEGAGPGVQRTLERGISPDSLVQHDLRHPLFLGRRFDVALCTEVVEHVEPPFSSQIILTNVLHADVIFFSFMSPSPRNNANIRHPNERPSKMWKNLFDFYGYGTVDIPLPIQKALVRRGDFVAYRRDNTTLRVPTAEMFLEQFEAGDDTRRMDHK